LVAKRGGGEGGKQLKPGGPGAHEVPKAQRALGGQKGADTLGKGIEWGLNNLGAESDREYARQGMGKAGVDSPWILG